MLKVATFSWPLLNIEKSRTGYVHFGLGCILVRAGKWLYELVKKREDKFLMLCSVSLGSVVQFSTVHV